MILAKQTGETNESSLTHLISLKSISTERDSKELSPLSPNRSREGTAEINCVCLSVCVCVCPAPLKRLYLRNYLGYNNETCWKVGPIDCIKISYHSIKLLRHYDVI